MVSQFNNPHRGQDHIFREATAGRYRQREAKLYEKEKILLKKLERLASKMAKVALPADKGHGKAHIIYVFLLNDAEMKRLKKRFLPREKGPANVLSFGEPADWPNPEGGPERLGEIYLNLNLTDGRLDKLTPLLLHGVLHLLGYDHKKKNDRIKMEKLEKELIGKLDIR